MPVTPTALHWLRWLSARGLPPGHVARVLDVAEADVAEALARPWHAPGEAVARRARVRELRAAGESYPAIARAMGISNSAAHYLANYHPRRPPDPSGPPMHGRRGTGRSILADLARKVRRLHELGYGPAVIAELLALDVGRVTDYVARLTPKGLARARVLAKPRGRREHAGEWDRPDRPDRRPRRWPRCRAQDDVPIAISFDADHGDNAVAELPRAEITGPAVPDDWGMVQEARARGASASAAKLSDADADRARELRRRGVPRKDVAAMLGVSVATITRITRGETYRPVAVEPDQVVIIEPPAEIAAAEPPRVDEHWARCRDD